MPRQPRQPTTEIVALLLIHFSVFHMLMYEHSEKWEYFQNQHRQNGCNKSLKAANNIQQHLTFVPHSHTFYFHQKKENPTFSLLVSRNVIKLRYHSQKCIVILCIYFREDRPQIHTHTRAQSISISLSDHIVWRCHHFHFGWSKIINKKQAE